MKRTLCLVLAVVIICIGLSACGTLSGGSSSLYAKVTYSNGVTETLDVGEIPDLCSENVTAFNQKYAGQEIEVVDKISDIGSGYGTYGFIMIDTKNGWGICLKSDDPIIAELRDGDTVKIIGELVTQSVTIQNATVTKVG
ncbi:MAG: hypothetical protein IJN07_02805 [Clostridia bacterium]|nr:hypothetical protein [Clostridia bacterium]